MTAPPLRALYDEHHPGHFTNPIAEYPSNVAITHPLCWVDGKAISMRNPLVPGYLVTQNQTILIGLGMQIRIIFEKKNAPGVSVVLPPDRSITAALVTLPTGTFWIIQSLHTCLVFYVLALHRSTTSASL